MRVDKGKLFVFEGPDGTGKTTLSQALSDYLNRRGFKCKWFSFPGLEAGTLGKHVYKVHHDPQAVGIKRLNPTSIQLLHIAAHVDTIETQIVPALMEGCHVVLDRFWWSTLVYGKAAGANHQALTAMIQIERLYWGKVLPSHIFLLQRKCTHGKNPPIDAMALEKEYVNLAMQEAPKYPVTTIRNDAAVTKALEEIILRAGFEVRALPHLKQNGSSFKSDSGAFSNSPVIFTKLTPAKTTVVYDTYWRFAAERQAVFFRKLTGDTPPWTDDPILLEYKFTNAYRASDRTSQYLISEVIYAGKQTPDEIFFRTIIFKLFNRIETWELLEQKLGQISYHDYSFSQYDEILTDAINNNGTIYSGAYIMPSGGPSSGSERKHRMHLRLIERMLKDELPLRLSETSSMGKAFELLRAYPTIGDFLAYQYVTDLNYSILLNFSEMEFAVPGPGALDGIRKCFSDLGGLNTTDIIKLVADRQEMEFERRGEKFQSLWGRRLQLIDCQNLFCEVDKYSRIRHPEFAGRTGRVRIKQKYRITQEPIQFWYPPKWGLNDKIVKGGLSVSSI
jgi:thymidylate kinase